MAEAKTKPTTSSVAEFLDGIENEQRRRDAREVMELMTELTGNSAEMWGPSIVGFGRRNYEYESGRAGEWFIVGFSPRKEHLVLYGIAGVSTGDEALSRLGKHKTGKGCLYIKKMEDVDRAVLRELVKTSIDRKESSRIS